jgi:type IV pilus assembly protein PilA
VTSVTIAAATGIITITTSLAAGGGTLTMNPYTSPGGVATALPAGGAAFAPPTDALQWQCRAAGSALIAPGSAAGTLLAAYAPASCR